MLGKFFGLMASSAIFAVSIFITGTSAVAQQEVVVHNFNNNGKDGYAPYAGVISDASGNLYGTTVRGGTYNYGTVFELSPKTGGGWAEKILHSFNSNGHGRILPLRRPHHRHGQQSLRHDLQRRLLQRGHGVRVVAEDGWRMD